MVGGARRELARRWFDPLDPDGDLSDHPLQAGRLHSVHTAAHEGHFDLCTKDKSLAAMARYTSTICQIILHE